MSRTIIAFDGETLVAAIGVFGVEACTLQRLPRVILGTEVIIAAYGTARIVAAVQDMWTGAHIGRPTYDSRTEVYFGVAITRNGAWTVESRERLDSSPAISLTARLDVKPVRQPALWFTSSSQDYDDVLTDELPESARQMVEGHLDKCDPPGCGSAGIGVTDIFPGF
jgi:hypothetical protein